MMSDEHGHRFAEGVSLFNRRAFFDAHDVWEELWMETRGRKRLFYQGMIQAAVAYYHALNANNSGASNLMQRAIHKLEGYLPAECGILLVSLLPVLRRHAQLFAAHSGQQRLVIDETELPLLEIETHIS